MAAMERLYAGMPCEGADPGTGSLAQPCRSLGGRPRPPEGVVQVARSPSVSVQIHGDFGVAYRP